MKTKTIKQIAKELWVEHGGGQHGPKVETMEMAEKDFKAFAEALWAIAAGSATIKFQIHGLREQMNTIHRQCETWVNAKPVDADKDNDAFRAEMRRIKSLQSLKKKTAERIENLKLLDVLGEK